MRERRARGSPGSRLQYLLLEVANGILISVGEEIQDVVFDVILLQVVHQVGSVALIFQKENGMKQAIEIQFLRPRCL